MSSSSSSSADSRPLPGPLAAPPTPQSAKLLRAVAHLLELGDTNAIANATDYLQLCVELHTGTSIH